MGETIAEELAPFRDRISLAFVFGSIARGTDGADSDVDLMVVGHIDAFELGETIERIERKLGRSLDLNLHLPEVWEALKTDRVVAAILGQPKIMLHGGIPQPSGAQPATRAHDVRLVRSVTILRSLQGLHHPVDERSVALLLGGRVL
ncbi:nucleotidyltransferase domain-containing protein [Rhizobium leguminosarum]|uniref:nucleotidyltransferase domain-containing protein n=1 Tax=Rhizobium leguminosarum TaxID=384 RepID=UPI0021BC315C|nr:nucleotidyltransferase domain-containing protein [Rhizobium leguminosarum]